MSVLLFLERFLSVSLQATLIVAATYWIGRVVDSERTRSRLWTLCFTLLLLLVVNAAFLPHVRLLPPVEAPTRPLAADLLTLELQLGRLVFVLWIVGLLGSLALLIYRSIMAERFLRTCRAVDPDVVSLAEATGTPSEESVPHVDHRPVRLVSTPIATSPFCWQFHAPYIVIPESLLTYDRDDLKYILRHELAHLRTGHPLQVFLQRTVETVFWFHPLIWWASRESALAREFQCDDEAVESRGDIVRYLKTLLTIVEQTATQSRPAATLTFVWNRCELAERARRLVRIAQQDVTETDAGSSLPPRQRTERRSGPVLLTTIAFLSAVFLWMPVNLTASTRSHWSPWPAWSADVLNDFGIKTRDFESGRYGDSLHELLEDDDNRDHLIPDTGHAR